VEAFALSFGVILLAELGDKSQLIAVAFTARYRPWVVLAGISLATLLINAASVVLGAAFAAVMPTTLLEIVGGLLFLAFGALALLRSNGDAETCGGARPLGGWAVLAVAGAYLLAEVGDKTMLAMIALAATHDPVWIWLGGSTAMIGANAVAILLARLVGSRLPEKGLRYLSAAAFIAFGVLLLLEGLNVL
jgi:putative Ca2+/H+ antiporter (TMEM165/GDT1 family)